MIYIAMVAFLLISLPSWAAEIKFGFLESPSQRVAEFERALPIGTHLSGFLVVNGMSIPLPAGDWMVIAVSGDVPTLNNVGTDQKSDSVPHGKLMLTSTDGGDGAHPKKIIVVRTPLGSFKNRTWLSSLPGICNPDWSKDYVFNREFLSLDQRGVDCRVIYYGRVFSWNDFLVNSGKVGLNSLGRGYGNEDNYLLSGIFISKNNSVLFFTYGELVDGNRYKNASDFRSQHDADVVRFQSTVLPLNDQLRKAFDSM